MVINFQNVKDLILSNKKVTDLLPGFKHFFDTWKFSVINPTLKSLGDKAIIDFLLSLKPENIKVLEQYFSTSITVDVLDYRIVKNVKLPLGEEETLLEDGFSNFSIYRDSNHLYISYWR